jgi:hypothetical protein
MHLPRLTVAAFLTAAALLLGVAGCASDKSAAGGASKGGNHPIRVLYVHYKSNQKLELIDQSLSSSSDYYSQTRKLENAGTKVTSDEVLQELLDFFESKGFFDKGQGGPAPSSGEGVYLQALEVESSGRIVHMSMHKATPVDDIKLFLECQKAFVTIYNGTYQLQSVDRAPDWNVQGVSSGKKKSDG